jgi:hypothetical protein
MGCAAFRFAACGESPNEPKYIPQGLKPLLFCGTYGTAEAVPFQNMAFITGCPVKT